MALRLRLSSGPDAGWTSVFTAPRVTIGRGVKNDLVLRDGMVSQHHGELVSRAEGYVYRDLMSRHGTVAVVNNQRCRLHDRTLCQEMPIFSGTHLLIGETVLDIDVIGDTAAILPLRPTSEVAVTTSGQGDESLTRADHIVARAHDSLDALTRRLSGQDPRLASIIKLSRNLNGATDLGNILELIAESTFEAFPAANFFAITLLPDDGEAANIHRIRTLISRSRQGGKVDIVAPLLSTSLLEQVANTRESVLFVRDFTDRDISQSIINARITACLAAPLVGQHSLIGVMQADTRGLGGLFGTDDLDLFTVMASYAAFGIERAWLNSNILEMFEGIARASTKAIDARDPSTAGHSGRVAYLAVALAQAINEVREGRFAALSFADDDLKALRYAALLHDFGKIGVRESILTKNERLYGYQKDLLTERFQAIKAFKAVQAYRRELETLVKNQTLPCEAQLQEAHLEVLEVNRQLDELLRFMLTHQAGAQLGPDLMDRFREIGRLSFKDLGGSEHPYLLPDELAQLCVAEGTLTSAEWEDMMSHVRRSQEYLDEIPWTSALVKIPAIAGAHHEKLDGSGYPDGLTADQILPQTRILTICDMFDAMTAIDRPYRKAVDVQTAVKFLRQDAGRGLIDADLVELFVEKVLPALVGSDEVQAVDTGDNALASGQFQFSNDGAKGD